MDSAGIRSLVAAFMASLAFSAVADTSVTSPLPADYMLGTWTFDRTATDKHIGALVFLPNGTYLHLETGPNEGSGYPGFEVGTYNWSAPNSSTVSLAFKTELDTNGDWGTHVPGVDNEAALEFETYQAGGMKCVVPGDQIVDICSSTIGNTGLVGGWYAGSGYGNISVIVFLPNGKYLQAIDPAEATFETGTYNFDAATGALTVSQFQRYGGTDQTLSQMGSLHAGFVGGQLTLDGVNGDLSLGNVPVQAVPEPSPPALLLLGLLGLGAVARQRRR